MLTEEQASQIKQQLLKQLDKFPDDKRDLIKKQILAMSTQDVENFINQNQLSHLSPEQKQQNPQQLNQCIFCSIIKNQIPSYKIDENKDNIAILEINPISQGHSLIIPKKHIELTEKLPTSSFALAKKIARKIQTKFHPLEIKISSQKITNHSFVEVLPLYETTIPDKRTKATKEELLELQEKIKAKPKIKKIKSKKNPDENKLQKQNLPQLKPRIP